MLIQFIKHYTTRNIKKQTINSFNLYSIVICSFLDSNTILIKSQQHNATQLALFLRSCIALSIKKYKIFIYQMLPFITKIKITV